MSTGIILTLSENLIQIDYATSQIQPQNPSDQISAHHYWKLKDSKYLTLKKNSHNKHTADFTFLIEAAKTIKLCTAKTLNLCTMHEVKSFQKKTHKFDTVVRVLNDGHLQNYSLEMH
jgi:hypothetical protein